MKKTYIKAEMKITHFDNDEVIVASAVTTTEWELDEDELPPWIIQ